MGRPRLTVNRDNFGKIYTYIRENIYNNDMTIKFDWPETISICNKLPYAVPDFLSIQFMPSDPKQCEALQAWCDKWLNAKSNSREWNKIKDAIRAKRKRKADKEAGISKQPLSVEPYAHTLATYIAEYEKITVSEVLEKYLEPIYRKHEEKSRRKSK
ncbi:hypothetical protein [Spartinivicinus poritis]|uniref:Uncharacterized protein n=1 Tax=Spartinivicinus poritis TaxID=2994640 RepID=A0ABT5UGK5_9GAMM|nr:hypothetical protein [Spartinivicinus sp. A2-2]MDE1465517.1 hypothetical protein [Spartinivicinus sp. A2-2]